jgi:hypothetical protein
MDKLINIGVACSIAGATAVAIVAVPRVWHPRDHDQVVAFNWPPAALEEPSAAPKANMLATASNDIPLPETSHKVATEKYTLVSEREKSPPAPKPLPPKPIPLPPPPKVEPDRDYCYPGHRVDHGRRWRCVYAHGRHRHRG